MGAAAQPFVAPIFDSPAPPANNKRSPSRLSAANIMGICTVAVLFTALVIIAIVVCTWREKEKEIDLSKPLILTEEISKVKKKKKGSQDEIALEEVSLVNSRPGEAEMMELPPRTVSEPRLPSADYKTPEVSQTSLHDDSDGLNGDGGLSSDDAL